MEQDEITVEGMELSGFVYEKAQLASYGVWGIWMNKAADKRLWLWECQTSYFEVPDSITGWKCVRRLPWPFSASDVTRAMQELGWA